MVSGSVRVVTKDNGDFTPEELAAQCVDELISISDVADPAIREQARAFRGQAARLIARYIARGQAVEARRWTRAVRREI
jgi:hypothetical protein